MTEADETHLRDLLVQRGWQIERLTAQILTLTQQLQALTERLAQYERPANQLPADPLPPPATEPPPTPQLSEAQKAHQDRRKRKRKAEKKARKATRLTLAAAALDHQDTVLTPPTCCACQHPHLTPLGTDTHQVITWIPAKLVVKVVHRQRSRCRACSHITVADGPTDLLPKRAASPSLLAHLIHAKYALHLPLYRLRQELDRMGLRIHEGTLDTWMAAPASLLTRLLPALKAHIFQHGVVHFDGTGYPVLTKGGTTLGQIAVVGNAMGTLYSFAKDKGSEPVHTLLGLGTPSVYGGKLVCDADGRLDAFFKAAPATECGCNAHGRRYFEKAEENDPASAHTALCYWQQLYQAEQQAQEQGLTGAALLAWRQNHQAPIAANLKTFLESLRGLFLPKEPIHQAVMYALRHWAALMHFLKDPTVPMDNNFAERCLRRIVVGRKNHLFVGSVAAGERLAVYVSFMETCRVQGVDPVAWLTAVLPQLVTARPSQLAGLLPGAWKAAQIEVRQAA